MSRKKFAKDLEQGDIISFGGHYGPGDDIVKSVTKSPEGVIVYTERGGEFSVSEDTTFDFVGSERRRPMSDTTTELERLRADLEVFERYAERQPALHHECDRITREIARLEAEQADPWRKHKELMDIWRRTTGELYSPHRMAVEIYDHLTAENARLTKKSDIYDRVYDEYQVAKASAAKFESENIRLAARVAELERNYGLANDTIKTATKRLNEEKAEKERLAARVVELEAEIKAEDDADIADAEEALSKYMEDECKAGYAKSEKALAEMVQMNQDMGLYEAAGTPMVDDGDVPNSWPPGKPLPDMQPPFEGPIVGLEPVLDPARVLATAAEVVDLLNMDGIGYLIRHQMRHLNPKAYPVRKNPDGSPQFQRKGAERGE